VARAKTIKEFLAHRIQVLEEAAVKSIAQPNPWRHRQAELKLVLAEVLRLERKSARTQ